MTRKQRVQWLADEIERLSRDLGEWYGRMIMSYVASQEAWKAGMVQPGDPKVKASLEKALSERRQELRGLLDDVLIAERPVTRACAH